MAVINQFVVKDATTIREDIVRTIKNGLYYRGVGEPNVGPGSDFYVVATALGNELSVIGANAVLKADAQMPDTATNSDDPNGDQDLTRQAKLFDLEPQPATGSVGNVILKSSGTSPIGGGAQLTDDLGQVYAVTLGGTYANGALVPIQAVSTGEATNLDPGTVLKWKSAPPYASDKAAVDSNGLRNGADAEDGETLRQRILAKIQVPPGSANWEDVIETAEASSNSVAKAFSYPAHLGPATCGVAVTAAPTPKNKSRVVDSSIMTGTVVPYMNRLPRFGYLNITTVEDVVTDVSMALSLPNAPTANPPGAGGGWIDGSTWPLVVSGSLKCTVAAVTSTTVITVDALSPPLKGVSHIAWLSPYDWTLYRATVADFSGSAGAYTVTLDRPLVGITTGCYIWPDCENAQAYIDALLLQYSLMGPGEKSSNASVLERGFRHPSPIDSWQYSLGPHLLHAVINSSDEIASAQFLHRTDGTQTVTESGPSISPLPPASLQDPPRIYIPRHIGFYRLPS